MIVDRDVELLSFMSQWQFMIVRQCAEYLGCSEQVARRRLRSLRSAGLVDVTVPFADYRQVYWVNKDGLKFLRKSLPVDRPRYGPKISQFVHDRILVDLAVSFHRENPSYTIFGELEMRRLDAEAVSKSEETQFALKRWQAGRYVSVFPDMSAVKGNARFVIEYEHTKKQRQRLRSLMYSYATSTEVTAVKYYVAPAAYSQAVSIYKELEPTLPLVGGKPKLQVSLYEDKGV